MKVKIFPFNPLQENTFVLYDDTGECAIVDPGCFNDEEFKQLDSFITENNLKPVKLINTHCHFDHIFGVDRCREKYGLQWEAHPDDAFLVESAPSQGAMFGMNMAHIEPAEKALNEGDAIKFGNTTLQLFHVPGHSPGSLCFYDAESGNLIVGDVLFRGSIGRTDLPKGDYDTLIGGIKQKLLPLPNGITVFPGHGPTTTIANEIEGNPFLQ
ncbi:MAG: MBL fold metallo-hydrolase [Prolixibacteraceae bacterium]|jgi:hydroxyacylglutathione hydrolase|nr:MBL fold metallo-hydrolase [Prolixibacteraceae bacterium]